MELLVQNQKLSGPWQKMKSSTGNSKTLNAIFNGVDRNIFRLINTYILANENWDILVTHEGTFKVKMSRLQFLTSKLESLKMMEEETIADFHDLILDITNESFSHDEKILKKS